MLFVQDIFFFIKIWSLVHKVLWSAPTMLTCTHSFLQKLDFFSFFFQSAYVPEAALILCGVCCLPHFNLPVRVTLSLALMLKHVKIYLTAIFRPKCQFQYQPNSKFQTNCDFYTVPMWVSSTETSLYNLAWTEAMETK